MQNPDIVKLKFKFLFDRGKEILNRKTLDSYRVRVMNPQRLLIELSEVVKDFYSGKVKNFNPTVTDVAKELAVKLEQDETGLKFPRFEKNILLNEMKKFQEKNYKKGALLTKLLLNDNLDYQKELLAELKLLLTTSEVGTYKDDLRRINLLLGYLITDRVKYGVSRSYIKDRLHKYFNNILSDYNKSFDAFALDLLREKEEYQIIFKVWIRNPKKLPANDIGFLLLDHIDKKMVRLATEHHFFLQRDYNLKFVPIGVSAHDFHSALDVGKTQLALSQDLVNLGLIQNHLEVQQKVCVVHKSSARYRIIDTSTELDGNYLFDDAVFVDFINSLKKISHDDKKKNVMDRLQSALRYLRLGHNSSNIEYEFLNYWIGLEYIFSAPDSNTIKNIKAFLPKIHAVHYYQRKIKYFEGTLRRGGINKINGKQINLSTLCEEFTYDELINKYQYLNPVIFIRANELKKVLTKQERKKDLERHVNNLESHLTRIYRIRNQIVHEAYINMNIEMITSNLKYYLIFILERSVWTIEDNNDLISLEGIFIYYEAIYEKIKGLDSMLDICQLIPFKTMVE